MGFGSLDNANDLTNLHISKANAENLDIAKKEVVAEEFDDHDIHILEHTRFLLSGSSELLKGNTKEKLVKHLREHKAMKNADNRAIDGDLTNSASERSEKTTG
jgi:predicted choloylglycine hydrolase